MFDKIMNSKINEVADWIIRLFILNFLIIFFSLGIITIYPALSAGYNMFNDYANKKSPKLFSGYFKYFKEALGYKIILNIIIVLVFLLGYLNIRYYDLSLKDNSTTFLLIGYYVSLALVAMWAATTFYSIVVFRVNTKVKFFNLLKLSFYLAGKYYFLTLLIVITVIAPAILILLNNSITTFIFVFLGVSVPLIFQVLITKPVVRYIEKIGDKNG